MCLSGYLDPYPVLFHGVSPVSLCLNNSLTHPGSPYHNHTRTAAGPGASRLALPGRLSARPIRRFIFALWFFHMQSFHTAHTRHSEQGTAEVRPHLALFLGAFVIESVSTSSLKPSSAPSPSKAPSKAPSPSKSPSKASALSKAPSVITNPSDSQRAQGPHSQGLHSQGPRLSRRNLSEPPEKEPHTPQKDSHTPQKDSQQKDSHTAQKDSPQKDSQEKDASLPTEPPVSCWMRHPSGCPCAAGSGCHQRGAATYHPAMGWNRDTYGETNLNSRTYEGCTSRAPAENAWCGTTDVVTYYVPQPGEHRGIGEHSGEHIGEHSSNREQTGAGAGGEHGGEHGSGHPSGHSISYAATMADALRGVGGGMGAMRDRDGAAVVAVLLGVAALVVLGVGGRLVRHASGYASLRRGGGGADVRVCFELGEGLREDGELSLAGVNSHPALREKLLQLADELLLDPDDDLGQWTLRYTDEGGALRPVEMSTSLAELRRHARELRVTAGKACTLA